MRKPLGILRQWLLAFLLVALINGLLRSKKGHDNNNEDHEKRSKEAIKLSNSNTFGKRLEKDVDPNSRRIRFPFANAKDDEKCANFSVKFAKMNSMPKILLLSYPGSGNTWLRFLVEGITGIFTASYYGDPVLSKVLYGEAEPLNHGTTFLAKAHRLISQKLFEYTKVVYLSRNPIDAVISSFNFQFGGGHTRHSRFTLNSTVFRDFLEHSKRSLPQWINMQTTATRVSAPVFVVHYELLKLDMRTQLTHLMHFLQIDFDKERLDCVLKHSEGNFHRSALEKREFPIAKNVTVKFEQAMCKFHADFKAKFGAGLPLSAYEMVIKDKYRGSEANPLPKFVCEE